MKNHLVMISPHRAMLDVVNAHNIECTIIDKIDNIKNYRSADLFDLIFINYERVDDVLSVLKGINESNPISAIVTLTEKAIPIAAKLSAMLGLSYTPLEVIEIIYDKEKMRNTLFNFEKYRLPFTEVLDKSSLDVFSKDVGLPIIVKPKDGVGSVNVKKISDSKSLESYEVKNNLIAEKYIGGDEFSVECFSFNGVHNLIAITKKITLSESNFTEVGHILPADISLKQQSIIKDYISDFLDIIGIFNGPSHTEIKIYDGNIYIIETHNRIGGDRISSLVKLATGIDLVELSILWPLGLCSPLIDPIKYLQYSSIRFIKTKKGFVKNINGIETLLYKPNIISVECNINNGDYIDEISDSFNRYGFVISTGSTYDKCITNSLKALNSISIEYG